MSSRTFEYVQRELTCPNRETPVMHVGVSMCKATGSCACLPGLACGDAEC